MSRHRKTLVNAFNLVPVVEKVLPDRPNTEVSCVSVADRCLYVGTTCGLIIYYELEQNKTPLGKLVFRSKVKGRIQLGSDRKKAVQQLTVVAAQKKLLALVDGFLYVMHMHTLELFDTGQRISRIQCYCVNESKSQTSSANFEIIVAPQRKKQLLMYALSGERMVHIKDFNIPEPAMMLARDDGAVCAAILSSGQQKGKYIIVNIYDSGKTIELLDFDPSANYVIKRTSKGEFLVNAGQFGVIAFATGVSNRPPVEWTSHPPKAATYLFPYVVSWSDTTENIYVYNLLDQRCIQEIPFRGGRFLGDFGGSLYAALDRCVYFLPQVPLREQVSSLLEKQLVEEAVLLAETIAAVEGSRDQTAADEYMCEVKQRAAFTKFSLGAYSQAEALFLESNCDPREVIVLFEGLLPSNSLFQSQAGQLHGIPSVQILEESGHLSVREAKKFLIRYLKEVRVTQLALGRREDIDTALVKLLAEDRSRSLIPYIENHELHLSFEETRRALEENSCFHALGLLFYYSNQSSDAISIWTRIADKELTDQDFPGFTFIINFLAKHSDAEVVLKYARWALQRDEEMASKIFTEGQPQLKPDTVLSFLDGFPVALVAYLETLINERGREEERYHTQLATCYLDDVLRLMEEEGKSPQQLRAARDKLLRFLEGSAHYHAPLLLSRVQDTELHMDCAVLYGRMEEHDKALTLLAHKLQDYERAKEYCLTYSLGRNRDYRQGLYQTLLQVYLRPSGKEHSTLIRPALSLLNSHGYYFDAAQVLELLPPDWPVATVRAFLLRSLRGSIDTFRTDRIEHSLARGENLQVRKAYIEQQGAPVVIKDTTLCPVCSLPFNDAAFVRYPNGVVTHLKCGRNKTICPITGTWFGSS